MSFTILAIGVLGFIGAFMTVSKSIHHSKTRAVATNLLQEKIEAMKNISYYRLIPTTAPATSSEAGITAFQYDGTTGFYPPETLTVGDIAYTRRVFVEKVSSAGAGDPTAVAWQSPDTGLKRIKAYVVWRDAGTWRSLDLHNLLNNPNRQFMSGYVTGTVGVTAGSPAGTTVMVAQNASWFDTAAAGGGYGFYVTPGTYTLTASLYGYFPKSIDNAYVGSSSTYTWSPTLTQMWSGTVTGTAYLRDHLVLSRVVGQSADGGFNQEYVEVYNPTTYTWTLNGNYGLKYTNRNIALSRIDVSFVRNDIAPSGFFLFANTTTVTINGTPVGADAIWTSDTGGWNDTTFPNFNAAAGDPNVLEVYTGSGKGEGGLVLYNVSTNLAVDTVGWKGGGGSSSIPSVYEGTNGYLNQTNGLDPEEQFGRYHAAASYDNTTPGPAYDTNFNDTDWNIQTAPLGAPRNALSAVRAPTTGTPATGAWVSGDDGYSAPVQCSATGAFSLISVGTGTWSVGLSTAVSTTGYYKSNSVTLTTNGQTVSLGTVAIDSATANGFIAGTVRAAVSNTPLSGITVQTGSGAQGSTGASGRYSISMTPGQTSVTANPGNLSNSAYVSDTQNSVDVATGVFTTGIDFTLDTGGKIRGYVQIGSNPLPGVPITATDAGSLVAAETASDTNGYFTLSNLSTGTYSITPQMDSGETYTTAGSTTVAVTAGTTLFSATFTVTNAFGYITGSLATAAGLPLKTGVLVVASTGTISTSYPPDVDSALRSGTVNYYVASSFSDGTYELYVPGGNSTSPTAYNVYAWYTTWNGSTATVTKKNTTASVTGGSTTSGRNFTW
jgi:hypothetical protein